METIGSKIFYTLKMEALVFSETIVIGSDLLQNCHKFLPGYMA